ncbi:MAG: efflux RND transporter periplasmic adaptor subunit, partial [Chthoniobacterales bacterium]
MISRLSQHAFAWPFVLAVLLNGCGKSGGETNTRADRRSAVTALGRVTPGREAIAIAAQTGSRILKLEVADGKRVHAGDVLAYLDTYPLQLAERDAANVALSEARERLETETQYAHAVVEQNEQAVHVLEVSLDRERRELTRIKSMKNAIEAKQLDDQKFTLDKTEGELAKARAELRAAEASLARTHSMVAVESAEAKVKSAEQQLELTIIRAPIDGEVLKVFTYPGERIGNDPILKMGDTADMHVIAEVHETDVGGVRVGQRATITSAALPEPVSGTVEEIGGLIYKNDVLDIDPRADKDSRIVEVRIK